MSWIEKINNKLTIITGDGKPFTPLWTFGSKTVEYNIAEFEFVDIEGALVNRRKPKARRFDIVIHFEGENNIENSIDFENSAKDPRAWTLSHPFYGDLIVQPIGLSFDNSKLNITTIKGTVIETISDEVPKGSDDPKDKIADDVETVNSKLTDSYANNVTPDTQDINDLKSTNTAIYNDGKKVAKDDLADKYFNSFNTANAAILNATAEPLAAIRSLQTVINAPALFAENVKTRLDLLTSQFLKLRAAVPNITKKAAKFAYETNGGSLITTMILSVSTPTDSDYPSKIDVLDTIDSLLNYYDFYLQDLDSLQSLNGGGSDSYIPSADPLTTLSGLLNFAVSNLFTIAMGAKQERIIFLEEDSNLILLAHRFYGLVADDSTIVQLMNQNNIGLTEILNIKKGRKIIYYIG